MMTKVCSKCKAEKSVDCFYKNKSRKDGLQSYCKECKGSYDKKFCITNAEKISAKSKLYKKLNAEKIALASKQYYLNNRKRLNAVSWAWNKNNPGTAAAYNKRKADQLVDSYVTLTLRIKNPPKELIELKRVQLLITRELRNKSCQL